MAVLEFFDTGDPSQFDAFPNFRALMLHRSKSDFAMRERAPTELDPPQEGIKRPPCPWASPLQPNPMQQSDPARLGPPPGGEAGRGPSSPRPVLEGPAPSGKHQRQGGRLYKSWFLPTCEHYFETFLFFFFLFFNLPGQEGAGMEKTHPACLRGPLASV